MSKCYQIEVIITKVVYFETEKHETDGEVSDYIRHCFCNEDGIVEVGSPVELIKDGDIANSLRIADEEVTCI